MKAIIDMGLLEKERNRLAGKQRASTNNKSNESFYTGADYTIMKIRNTMVEPLWRRPNPKNAPTGEILVEFDLVDGTLPMVVCVDADGEGLLDLNYLAITERFSDASRYLILSDLRVSE